MQAVKTYNPIQGQLPFLTLPILFNPSLQVLVIQKD